MREPRGVSSRRSAVVLVALAQLAVGAAAIFARFALVGGGPLAISAARLAIGVVPIAALAALRGRLRPIDGRTERRLLLAGLVLAAHFGTWIASLQHASVAISTLLVCSVPVWSELWTVARNRRVDVYAAVSVVGALVGVAIVVGVPDRGNTPLGIVLALLGAIAFAAYLLIVRGTDPRYDTVAVTARTYSIAAVALAVVALLVRDPLPRSSDLHAWGGIVAMALISQLFGHTAMNAAVRVLSATVVATFTLLEPVFAAALAAVLFHERLGPTTAIGATIIFVAIGFALRAQPEALPDA